jgi:hypothetical protein
MSAGEGQEGSRRSGPNHQGHLIDFETAITLQYKVIAQKNAAHFLPLLAGRGVVRVALVGSRIAGPFGLRVNLLGMLCIAK